MNKSLLLLNCLVISFGFLNAGCIVRICKDGWLHYGNYCYRNADVNASISGLSDANSYCQDNGGQSVLEYGGYDESDKSYFSNYATYLYSIYGDSRNFLLNAEFNDSINAFVWLTSGIKFNCSTYPQATSDCDNAQMPSRYNFVLGITSTGYNFSNTANLPAEILICQYRITSK